MSGNIGNLFKNIATIGTTAAGYYFGGPLGAAAGYYGSKKVAEPLFDKGVGAVTGGPKPPAPPAPANYDDATMAANQAQDLQRRRRGVLANIYGGSQPAAPSVATKTLLGT